ncbi:MAG: FAD-dependent monooxygenase [Devosia sp.]
MQPLAQRADTSETRTIYVVGAGIAGLTLTLALAKFGARVVLLERAAVLSEVGAGLQVSPNARQVLNGLGLDRPIADASFEPAGIDVYPHGAGHPIGPLLLGAAAERRFGAPYAVMHRADLVDVLYRACRRFANVDMLFGIQGFSAEVQGSGVSLEITEADGRTRGGRGFALVGADGVHSQVRTQFLGEAAARPTGSVAWRALLPAGAVAGVLSPQNTSLMLGSGYHGVIYPLPHRGQVNVVVITRQRPGDAGSSAPRIGWSLTRSGRLEAVLAAAEGRWSQWPLLEVRPRLWHRGPIGLVGDAAHAMPPFQAQGAAMAIEDAAALAPLLVSEPSAEAAFARYAAARRGRVERVRKQSSANGRIFHLPWPLSVARDTVVRLGGSEGQLRRLGWLYGHNAMQRTGHKRD